MMKFIQAYSDKLGCNNADAVFAYLIDTLKPTIKGWDYFVNWGKVIDNYAQYKTELNILNSVIGEPDIENAMRKVFDEYPRTKQTIPLLLASRDNKLRLMTSSPPQFEVAEFDFANDIASAQAVVFMKKTGLLALFQDRTIKSIPDFVLGVEAGLDSHARKNRGGGRMEQIVEHFVEQLCKKPNDWAYLTQATAKKIREEWGIAINTDKADREIDFALLAHDRLYLIETNFYGGGGSKLKATAKEYRADFLQWGENNHQFIWITDGAGWRSTKKPLREVFDATDYILNLAMLGQGILEDVLTHELNRGTP